ncbi:Nucleic acid-binding OB-fold [Pyrenophora seminiperda CCB06]|uniref:Nucleic acid-binding OB-fold n=1 Tax=Pyrenophora seminiperda CCB06 TaxID=1302712 RepID=A0A3M7M2X9_9PLEO|nr:Nucleic acid-binding OB-fold [Pyrenophora seminiperda CCB06]
MNQPENMSDNPPEQSPARGNTVPPALPSPGNSAKDSAPATIPTPRTPRGPQGKAPIPTSYLSNTLFPARTPRTPGSTALSTCTDDKSLYNAVTVHTAKCTECDQRNKKTMLRCPGCTFQLCQPCYDKREKRGKGLIHGNMTTPNATEGAAATPETVSRTVRKKPVASTPTSESTTKKLDETKEEKEDNVDTAPTAKKPIAKKVPIKRKRTMGSSETELSSEDNFDPEAMTATPSKRGRTELTFAESARATAGRTPPATRASRKAVPQEPLPPSVPTNVVDPHASADYNTRRINELFRQHGVEGWDEPLLGRREPVMSNPVAIIPDIIKRGVRSVSTAVISQSTKEQKEEMENVKAEDKNSGSSLAVTKADLQSADMTEADAERQEYLCTVEGFVEQEAIKYQNNITMNADQNKAVFHAMQCAALVWGQNTYKKLDHTQQQLQRGLKLRLDRIDAKYQVELANLVGVHALRMLQDLGFPQALKRQ